MTRSDLELLAACRTRFALGLTPLGAMWAGSAALTPARLGLVGMGWLSIKRRSIASAPPKAPPMGLVGGVSRASALRSEERKASVAGNVEPLFQREWIVGDAFEFLFPGWFVHRDPALSARAHSAPRRVPLEGVNLYGASFWLTKRA